MSKIEKNTEILKCVTRLPCYIYDVSLFPQGIDFGCVGVWVVEIFKKNLYAPMYRLRLIRLILIEKDFALFSFQDQEE